MEHDTMNDTGDEFYNPQPARILEAILRGAGVDLDGFRLSLWSGFYTMPVFAQIQRRWGLLRDENNILFCLVHCGPLTARGISQVLGRPKNSISRAVERLLARGLIVSKPVATDRRHSLLTVLPPGRELVDQTTSLFRARQEHMLRALTPVERVALDSVLTKLMADADSWLVAS
jgi:MarR family transcriptional regulator, temperature-dependent positive regulator of motility